MTTRRSFMAAVASLAVAAPLTWLGLRFPRWAKKAAKPQTVGVARIYFTDGHVAQKSDVPLMATPGHSAWASYRPSSNVSVIGWQWGAIGGRMFDGDKGQIVNMTSGDEFIMRVPSELLWLIGCR